MVAAQNRRLNERLLKLQAEERADLARDLHDEIGPLLFAVNMTAATIERLAGTDRDVDIPVHARSIHETVGRIQRRVRAILGRLRPLQNMELKTAIDRVVTFWGSRRPDVAFTVMVTVQDDRIDDDMRETIYRVIQEGMSNAIRHGAPTRVQVTIAHDGDDVIRVEVADDGVGMPADGKLEREPTQFGLKGMRERIMAMAGSLSIQRGHDGRGLALVVRLPCMKSPQYRNQDALE